MMHPRVSLNGLAADDELCRSLGVAQLCVPRDRLDQPVTVQVSAVLHPRAFTLDSPAAWASEQAALVSSVEAAAKLGARCVYVTTGPGWRLPWEPAAEAFAEAVRPVVPLAAARGVRLAVEPTNPLRTDIGIVHTLRDAVDLALACGMDVCVDFFACWYERGLRRTLRRAAGRIGLVQVSDFVLGTSDMPNRAVPGDGVIPLESLLAAVLEDGYAGAFDLELLGPRIEVEGVPVAYGRAAEWLSATLDRLGA